MGLTGAVLVHQLHNFTSFFFVAANPFHVGKELISDLNLDPVPIPALDLPHCHHVSQLLWQVSDLSQEDPLEVLHRFRNVHNLRLLACGGDGTVAWLLQVNRVACFCPHHCGVTQETLCLRSSPADTPHRYRNGACRDGLLLTTTRWWLCKAERERD